ncbi:MAG: DNA helicase RecQ [Candidatus Poribacteria bacterium]|nr:DNA helicase RecQ [Candidatus Poribacteria bacterium]
MRVLIVAKTRMGSGACIGAITEKGESVRLIPFNEDPHDGANSEYNVGDIWEIIAEPVPETSLVPPHVEDIVVREKHRLHTTTDTRHLVSAIELLMPPKTGDPHELYEGLLRKTGSGSLYVPAGGNGPPYSTTFWRTDKPLIRDTEDRRIRYRYPTENGGCTLTFVGFQEPLEIIPAGMLLRVSLAHRWRPEDNPEVEERCYAQISGWFFQEIEQEETGRAREDETTSQTISTQTPLEILTNVFGHDQFRPFQEEIIELILSRQDAFIVLPTGGGKSLCYQLPALIFDGLTVVVPPLISLMEDQVTQLQDRGIPAVFLNSTLNHSEYVATMQAIRQGETKLLYVAPETLVRPEILVMLDESNVECLAIDEAHCISQWGHDFRTDYRELVSIRKRFRSAVCIALTATATPRVQNDIQQLLGISEENKHIASFDRDNLYISVKPKVELLGQTLAFLRKHCNDSGIIYCQTIKQVESLCRNLTARRISVLPYHADLDDETRKQNQDAFINGNVRVMVATIAFGMGIDKADVRFVLHAGLPKEPESYYQEIGRSGRDGQPADCLLLFSYGDVDTNNYFIEQGSRSEAQGRQQRLQMLVSWATSIKCRRKLLLAYFGEEYEEQNCGMCDNCRRTNEEWVDLTIPAQKFLSCVYRTDQMFGEAYIIDVLRGSEQRRILENRHNQLSTHGIGTDYSKSQWRYLSYQFIQNNLLTRDAEHGSLRMTQRGWGVLRGEQFLGYSVDSVDNEMSEFPLDYSTELLELLSAERNRIAIAEGVRHFVVFHDKALQAMATYFPTAKEAFQLTYGVGPAKTEKYADDFLPIIRAYCQEHGID